MLSCKWQIKRRVCQMSMGCAYHGPIFFVVWLCNMLFNLTKNSLKTHNENTLYVIKYFAPEFQILATKTRQFMLSLFNTRWKSNRSIIHRWHWSIFCFTNSDTAKSKNNFFCKKFIGKSMMWHTLPRLPSNGTSIFLQRSQKLMIHLDCSQIKKN